MRARTRATRRNRRRSLCHEVLEKRELMSADIGVLNSPFAAGDYWVDVQPDHSDFPVQGEIGWFENEKRSPQITPGDANEDGRFNEHDIIAVLRSAKYLTGKPATWGEGDWNGDGVFDQLDIVAALQTGNYLQGPYAAGAVDAAFATVAD